MTVLTEAPARQDCGLRGLALLDLSIHQIELDPQSWHQGNYRCLSGMCVAGWMCELAGGQWLAGRRSAMSNYLSAGPGEPRAYPLGSGIFAIHALYRANNLLGREPLTDGGFLFDSDNDLAAIKRIRDELAAAGLS